MLHAVILAHPNADSFTAEVPAIRTLSHPIARNSNALNIACDTR